MEGNIIFREGDRVIYAQRMYYDVAHHVGTVINADVLTPVQSYSGLLRLHADVVQQTAPDRFFAENAFFTSSRMGTPGCRLQAGDVYFEDLQTPMVDPWTGQPVLDPLTGQQAIEHQRLMTASNDVLFVESLPVFYWPTIATDLNDPSYYIRRIRPRSDTIFGQAQLLTNWSGYELLGIENKPKGTDLDVSLDYLSLRGFGYGADLYLQSAQSVRHSRPRRRTGGLLGNPGPRQRQPRPGPRTRPARSLLPLPPLRPAPETVALRSATLRRTGLDQRPQLPPRVLRERVGNAQG